MNEHTHCWHNEPYVLTSYPPQQPQRCCHCNEVRILPRTLDNDLSGHGKYAPSFGAIIKASRGEE